MFELKFLSTNKTVFATVVQVDAKPDLMFIEWSISPCVTVENFRAETLVEAKPHPDASGCFDNREFWESILSNRTLRVCPAWQLINGDGIPEIRFQTYHNPKVGN